MAEDTTYQDINWPYNSLLERQDKNGNSDESEGALSSSGDSTSSSYPEEKGISSGNEFDNLWIKSWIKSRNYKPKANGFILNGLTGEIECASIIITGGSVDTSVLTGEIPAGNLNVADRGWVQSCVFSLTDADTVSWGSGTFTSADGTAYSIGSGNTGNMTVKTYIYLDTSVSITAYQVTTTATSAVGAGKVMIAIAQNGTVEATYEVLQGQGGKNINAAEIVAGSITANEIAASTITAGKMSITSLSSISANFGSMTSGDITIDTAGFIRGGQTAYNTGEGFWLGYTGGKYKFSLGNPAGDYLYWDGTNLALNGSTSLVGTLPWSSITDDGGKPDDNATEGAIWGTNLSGIPTTLEAPSTTGLYLSSSFLGYWKSVSIGSSTTQFDISNPVGTTARYFWDGTGTDPDIANTVRVGTEVVLNATNFNVNNNGVFTVTGIGTNYFEVTNAAVIAETNKTIGVGYIKSNNWNSYIDNSGNFFFRGDNDSLIDWNISTASTLTVKGKIVTITGSSVDGQYLTSNSVTSASANLALRGWTFTSVFSATDYRIVAWGAGTFTASDGTAYSIGASNTGNMATTTYIYLDIATSTTALQITTTAATAIGNGKVLIAVAVNNSDTTSKASYQVFGGRGGQTILVDSIAANSASTNEFISNTAQIANLVVTSAKINDLSVAKLTAGSITSKTITLAVSDGTGDVYIAAGKTDFDNTTAGFILGIDDSDSNKTKFYLGDATNYINWDGTNLTISGGVSITSKLDRVGGAYESAMSGARVLIFPDSSTGIQVIDNASNDVFKVLVGGTDVGDVIIGNYSGAQGVKYDKSAGTFDVKAILTANAGSSIGVSYLSGTISQSNLSIANQGWNQTCVFSVTDADTVAWASGNLITAGGTSYSISGSNTGNMSARTYIYFDIAVSTTAYQVTTTAATAVGSGKVLVATAINGSVEPTFEVFGGVGGLNINGSSIVAASITGAEITANTITSGLITTGEFITLTAQIKDAIITNAKISDLAVDKLTAGSITSKTITLAVSDGTGDVYIAAGKTDFDNSVSGFILGIDDSDSNRAKFYIGDADQYLNWDGNGNLTISASLNIDTTYTAASAITAGDIIEQGTSANNAQKQTIDDILSSDIYDVSALTSWSSQFVICKLDTNLYVGAWYKGSSTYSVAVFSYKNGKFIRGPIENTATDGRTPFVIFGIIKLSTTKALLAYTYDSGGTTNYGVRIYSVQSDKSLSVSSVTNLGSISTGTSGGLLTRISDDKFIAAWHGFGGANPRARCCTVSGTTITAGTTKDLGDVASTGDITSLILLDTDKLMVTVIQSSATRAAVLTVTGTTTITQGTVEAIANSNGNNATLSKLSTTKALVMFRNAGSNLLTSGILNVSGTTITEVAAQTQVDTGTPVYNIASIPYSSSLVGVFYKKDSPYDTNSWFKYLTVDGSDNITASNPLLFTAYSTIDFFKCDENLDDDFDALFFTGSKYLTGFSFKATKKSIGIAPSNISAAASGKIRSKGLITGLSGYAVGQNIRDRYDMSVIAIAKDTTILNII